ncbi:MAG: homocitrate synthase/isopropylmalate synthase family protein, partial [Thermoplasmata archaeon]
TYEPVQPELLGRQRQMVLGKHSGRAAIVEKLKERDLSFPDDKLGELVRRVKLSGESRSKEALRRFLQEYRALYERPGISDTEFWEMVRSVQEGGMPA